MTYEYAGELQNKLEDEDIRSKYEVWKCPRCSALVMGTEADRDHHENWHHSLHSFVNMVVNAS